MSGVRGVIHANGVDPFLKVSATEPHNRQTALPSPWEEQDSYISKASLSQHTLLTSKCGMVKKYQGNTIASNLLGGNLKFKENYIFLYLY